MRLMRFGNHGSRRHLDDDAILHQSRVQGDTIGSSVPRFCDANSAIRSDRPSDKTEASERTL